MYTVCSLFGHKLHNFNYANLRHSKVFLGWDFSSSESSFSCKNMYRVDKGSNGAVSKKCRAILFFTLVCCWCCLNSKSSFLAILLRNGFENEFRWEWMGWYFFKLSLRLELVQEWVTGLSYEDSRKWVSTCLYVC